MSTLKGDGIIQSVSGDFDCLVEIKETDKKQFILKKDILDKIEMEAIAHRRIPLVHVRIQDQNWVMMRERNFLEVQPKCRL